MGVFRKKLLDATELFTFSDFALLPGWSEVEPQQVTLASYVSRRIPVDLPFVSSPMESVTGSQLATAIAKEGGVGVLHRNCSRDEQAKMVKAVKTAQLNAKAKKKATLDTEGRLVVGAAVSPHDLDRIKALVKVVDFIVIDVAHFHTRSCFSNTRQILKFSPVDVIVGNIGTFEAAEDALSQLEGIAGLRCGLGSGSTCITSMQTRVCAPTLYAVASAADASRTLGIDIPIIADGGIRNLGDAALTLAAGAWSVMLGSLLAGSKESPSPIISHKGQQFKRHWGMGSKRARTQRFALDRYSHPTKGIDEGIEGLVPLRGSVKEIISEMSAALQASCGYIGAKNIPDMWEKARFARISMLGSHELQPHSILQNQTTSKNLTSSKDNND